MSYAHADKDRVRDLAEELEAQGVRVWVDWDITPSSLWGGSITDGLTNCSVVLVALTESSMRSPRVRQEIDLAMGLDRRIIPLLLDDTAPTGGFTWLTAIQWIDVRDGMKPEQCLAIREQVLSSYRTRPPEEASPELDVRRQQAHPYMTSPADAPVWTAMILNGDVKVLEGTSESLHIRGLDGGRGRDVSSRFLDQHVKAFAASPDGSVLAVASRGRITVFEVRAGLDLHEWPAPLDVDEDITMLAVRRIGNPVEVLCRRGTETTVVRFDHRGRASSTRVSATDVVAGAGNGRGFAMLERGGTQNGSLLPDDAVFERANLLDLAEGNGIQLGVTGRGYDGRMELWMTSEPTVIQRRTLHVDKVVHRVCVPRTQGDSTPNVLLAQCGERICAWRWSDLAGSLDAPGG
jgi:hypothetical protein